MNDKEKIELFILKATNKTVGRCKKQELATMFYNAYGAYVKATKELGMGWDLFVDQRADMEQIKILLEELDKHETI